MVTCVYSHFKQFNFLLWVFTDSIPLIFSFLSKLLFLFLWLEGFNFLASNLIWKFAYTVHLAGEKVNKSYIKTLQKSINEVQPLQTMYEWIHLPQWLRPLWQINCGNQRYLIWFSWLVLQESLCLILRLLSFQYIPVICLAKTHLRKKYTVQWVAKVVARSAIF